MKNLIIPALSIVLLFSACNSGKNSEQSEQASINKNELMAQAHGLFQQLPVVSVNEANPITEAKVKLGKILYFDKRLSKNNTISCNSCHNLATYGVDNKPVSPGDKGENGNRNSPTVFNAALHFTQFWDGRAKDVEEQAGGPILNPVEMGMPEEKIVLKRISSEPKYVALFKEAFPDSKTPVTYANLQNAIGAFERTLITPAKFDKFLGGDSTALAENEIKGLHTFIKTGCITCHIGPAIGGSMYQKFGLFGDYSAMTKSPLMDPGRFGLTKNEADKFMFKVPGLRNIEKTGPYFHDGSVAILSESIKIMAKLELNKDITDAEVADISAFLGTLTADIDPKLGIEAKL